MQKTNGELYLQIDLKLNFQQSSPFTYLDLNFCSSPNWRPTWICSAKFTIEHLLGFVLAKFTIEELCICSKVHHLNLFEFVQQSSPLKTYLDLFCKVHHWRPTWICSAKFTIEDLQCEFVQQSSPLKTYLDLFSKVHHWRPSWICSAKFTIEDLFGICWTKFTIEDSNWICSKVHHWRYLYLFSKVHHWRPTWICSAKFNIADTWIFSPKYVLKTYLFQSSPKTSLVFVQQSSPLKTYLDLFCKVHHWRPTWICFAEVHHWRRTWICSAKFTIEDLLDLFSKVQPLKTYNGFVLQSSPLKTYLDLFCKVHHWRPTWICSAKFTIEDLLVFVLQSSPLKTYLDLFCKVQDIEDLFVFVHQSSPLKTNSWICSAKFTIEDLFVFVHQSSPLKTYLYLFIKVHHWRPKVFVSKVHWRPTWICSAKFTIEDLLGFVLQSSPLKTYLYLFQSHHWRPKVHHWRPTWICSAKFTIEDLLGFVLQSSPLKT